VGEPEPIPVPTASKSATAVWKFVVAMVLGAMLFVGGLGAGIYFATHYQIVPVGEPVEKYASVPDLRGAELERVLPSGGLTEPVKRRAGPIEDGPFTFRFTPGEKLNYNLSANIGGQGQESDIQGVSPINMAMNSVMSLTTDSVDEEGTAALTMKFEQSSLQGDWMGSPFSMSTGNGETFMRNNGRTLIDSKNGTGSNKGVPQLEFLNTPINMKVAKNGEVEDVSGYKGIGSILSQLPMAANLEFPQSELNPQTQWESTLKLPIPGFAQPADARILNTFTGYQTVDGRKCGVIDQKILSFQTNGQLDSPESVFGEAMGFSMPNFVLDGGTTVYFDVDNGQLVRSDMDLDVTLEIGKALGEHGEVVQDFLRDLIATSTEDLPEFDDIREKAKSGANLLDFQTHVQATMQLAE
jgi:hypothetical protein